MPRRDLFAQRTCVNTALILACGLAAAQTPIDAERRALMATFETQEQACGTRFFVTDCQNAVAAQRRKALAELKRREDELETAQRQQRDPGLADLRQEFPLEIRARPGKAVHRLRPGRCRIRLSQARLDNRRSRARVPQHQLAPPGFRARAALARRS